MNILHFTNYYPPYIGGVGEICYYIVNSLVGEVNQKVLCFNSNHKRVIEKYHNVDVYRAKSLCQIHRQEISIDLFFLLRKILKEFKPDILHLHLPNPLACIYVLMLIPKDVKLIVHWHSDIIEQKYLYSVFKHFEKLILKRASVIITTSPLYGEKSIPLQPYRDKIEVVQNTISKEKVNITPSVLNDAKAIQKRYGNKPIVFTIGRHVTYKGIAYLIEAEKNIQSDCVVIIGGKGVLTEHLKKLAMGRKRIEFVGFLDDEEMIRYMCASTIFAFPSITKNEAFGIALAEAMYCGAVPVTFTIEGSGVNWVNVNGETGLEVANRDVIGYAKAIDLLLTDQLMCRKLSTNARTRVESFFTIETVKPMIMGIYNRVLDEPGFA